MRGDRQCRQLSDLCDEYVYFIIKPISFYILMRSPDLIIGTLLIVAEKMAFLSLLLLDNFQRLNVRPKGGNLAGNTKKRMANYYECWIGCSFPNNLSSLCLLFEKISSSTSHTATFSKPKTSTNCGLFVRDDTIYYLT